MGRPVENEKPDWSAGARNLAIYAQEIRSVDV